jgi:hypothetical protein
MHIYQFCGFAGYLFARRSVFGYFDNDILFSGTNLSYRFRFSQRGSHIFPLPIPGDFLSLLHEFRQQRARYPHFRYGYLLAFTEYKFFFAFLFSAWHRTAE